MKNKSSNKKYDRSNMRQVILDFPKQFRVGLKSAKNVGVREKFDAVLICGMGGSALPGNVLSMWMKDCKISFPLYIHRDYNLPYYADKKHLIIFISYSGNTEETLSAFSEASRKKMKMIAITSGGKLAELCRKHKIPVAIVPAGLQPRAALGYQSAALIKILVNCGVIRRGLKNISVLEKSLKPKILENRGKRLAKKLKNKIPLIYSSDRKKALARLWKIQINENSKTPAFFNYFPELNHNELVGYAKIKNNFHVIILRDQTDYSKVLKRMQLTAGLIKARRTNVDIIDIGGRNILYKIFSSFLLGAWVSYYLALEYGIDPTPVKIIEELKKKMAK